MSSCLLGVFLVFFIHTHTHTHTPCCAGSDEKGTKSGGERQDSQVALGGRSMSARLLGTVRYALVITF
jgi:hypothetical protein